MQKYLFRGVRKMEKDAGNILIPKKQDTFKSHPRLPLLSSFNLGERTEYAIREHQLGAETAGVSTSFNFKVAKKYAREKIVVKINRDKLNEFGIREYVVKEKGYMQINLEDEEVILVNEKRTAFPEDIIEKIINIK